MRSVRPVELIICPASVVVADRARSKGFQVASEQYRTGQPKPDERQSTAGPAPVAPDVKRDEAAHRCVRLAVARTIEAREQERPTRTQHAFHEPRTLNLEPRTSNAGRFRGEGGSSEFGVRCSMFDVRCFPS